MKLIEDLGNIYPTTSAKKRARCGIFECPDCGLRKTARFSNIKPNSKCRVCSRGTHNMRKHPLYAVWTMQGQRCNNPKNKDYKDYGERGIKRSDEFSDFKVWVDYIGSLEKKKDSTSIDRIDNDIGYERGNLKWSNQSEQMLNSRLTKRNKTGVKGVQVWKDKFQAVYKRKYLGVYNTVKEAEKAIVAESGKNYDTIS